VKSLAYFGHFSGPARDQKQALGTDAYCDNEQLENVDVLVLLSQSHA